MTSQDIGKISAYVLALKWRKKSHVKPDVNTLFDVAINAYNDALKMCDGIDLNEFVSGFYEAINLAFNGQKLHIL